MSSSGILWILLWFVHFKKNTIEQEKCTEKNDVLNLHIEIFIHDSLINMNSAIVGLPFKYAFKIKTVHHE